MVVVVVLGTKEEERECFSIAALGDGGRGDFELLLRAAWLEVTWAAVLGIPSSSDYVTTTVLITKQQPRDKNRLTVSSCSLILRSFHESPTRSNGKAYLGAVGLPGLELESTVQAFANDKVKRSGPPKLSRQ